MNDGADVLKGTESILLIDWPSRDVPDSLARAGYRVVSHDEPGVEDYNAYELNGTEVSVRNLGVEPDHTDLVYTHGPFDELPEIVEFAQRVGASAIWSEAGPETPGAEEPARWSSRRGSRTSMHPVSPMPCATIRDPDNHPTPFP